MVDLIFIKFFVVFVMAFLFGIERQFSNKPVGFGTFIFVSVGSCALTTVAETFMPENTLAILGGLITGVGFLGAGALIKTTDKIAGFTTAASIWVFSILGIIIGLGSYHTGVLIYAVIWAVVGFDKIFEVKGIGPHQRKVTIKTRKIVQKEDIIKMFKPYKWKLIDLEINRKDGKGTMVYLVSAPRDYVDILNKKFMEESYIESFMIE